MEILYIWLLEYKNIREQGFNFSSEFIFTTTKRSNDRFHIDIKRNPHYINNFFEKKNVLNVTAILGQNGTGKSNILEFIKSSFPSGFAELKSRAIISFRTVKGETEKLFLLIPDSLTGITIEENGLSFTKEYYPFLNADDAFGYEGSYTDATYIFYSNIVDLKHEDIDWADLKNISTKALMRSDNERSTPLGQLADYNFSNYLSNEIRTNIQFLVTGNRSLVKFKLPEDLFVSLGSFDIKRLKDTLLMPANILTKFVSDKFDNKDDLEKHFLDLLHVLIFITFLEDYKTFFTNYADFDFDSLNQNSIQDYVSDFFEKISSLKISHEQYGEVSTSFLPERSIAFSQFIEKTKRIISSKIAVIEKSQQFELPVLKLKITSESESQVIELLDLYIRTKVIKDFLDFNWRNMSSGEQSFFSIISRFHHVKNHDYGKNDIKDTIVILIDEGDVYFHPQWQKQFFKELLDFLSSLFADHKIQLIMTSNTPFLASDLPKNNLIFIERNLDFSVIVHNPENNQKDTFGGNIHTLFSDSFYLSGALMGDFAKYKINKIIEYLNAPEPNPINLDYKKTIELIGEPVLKRKLQQLWIDKFGVTEEIEFLEKRLDELKNKDK